MEINWQDIFYIIASLTMIVVFITCIWLIWFSLFALKLVRNIIAAIRVGSNIIEDVGYFRKGIKLKALSFLLKILEKGGKNEQQ